MHPEALEFCAEWASKSAGIEGNALDLGGQDVNGHPRRLWPWAHWHVVDAAFPHQSWPFYYDRPDGSQGVEWRIRGDATAWPPRRSPLEGTYGLVVSTELLEHVEDWSGVIEGASRALRRPDGLLVVTCAGPGRPPHGADGGELRAGEHYGNLEATELAAHAGALGLEHVVEAVPSSLGGHDIHLVARPR